jgi:hypothetical protein
MTSRDDRNRSGNQVDRTPAASPLPAAETGRYWETTLQVTVLRVGTKPFAFESMEALTADYLSGDVSLHTTSGAPTVLSRGEYLERCLALGLQPDETLPDDGDSPSGWIAPGSS